MLLLCYYYVIILFQVQQSDRLSARVCHACISYLNSWQSFKNRCNAAQVKQRTMLEMYLAKERGRQQQQLQHSNSLQQRQRMVEQQQRNAIAQQRILKQALSQPTMAAAAANNASLLTNNNRSAMNAAASSAAIAAPQKQTIDVVKLFNYYWNENNANVFNTIFLLQIIEQSFIKEEPEDAPQDEDEDVVMDPTQFLAHDDDDDGGGVGGGDVKPDGGPPILTSLGLTHINHVNPYNLLVCFIVVFI